MQNAYITKGDDLKIWGLTPYDRLVKTLRKIDDFTIIDDLKKLGKDDNVLLINGNYIYDTRIIKFLIKNQNTAIAVEEDADRKVVAIHTTGDNADVCRDVLNNSEIDKLPDFIKVVGIDDLQAEIFQPELKKVEKPYILNVSKTPIDYIENKLYYGSYKGVTDIVTRLVWPKPAKKAVRFCVDNKITPNQVTTLSLVLALLAGGLFYKHLYVLGLLFAWFMTFLDTVDGKLARVTVTYTKFGHIYDHLIDLVTPVYWYVCWGLSLFSLGESPKLIWGGIWVIVIFYIVGRIVEGSFNALLKVSFIIFCWKPFDSFFRLVTARRNPNLLILTISVLFNGFAVGFYLVALWTFISSVVLMVRLYQAYLEKKGKGVLTSWMDNVTPDMYNKKIYRLFIYEN
jgi:phosphatidylglycerophosphate synthase